MLKRYNLIYIFIILSLTLVFVNSNNYIVSAQELDNFKIELKIHDSFPKTIIINNNGSVFFQEGNSTKEIKVNIEKIKSLQQYIEQSNFFSLEERYPGSQCCDKVADTITVHKDGRTHSVYCYDQCPKEFDNLLRMIIELWPYDIKYQGWA